MGRVGTLSEIRGKGVGKRAKILILAPAPSPEPPADINAPTLTLTVGSTTYPPQFSISFDDTPEVGDTLRIQWANPGQAVDADGIFTAYVGGISHVITSGEAVAKAADVGLSAIASGTYQYQAYIIRGSSHSPASNRVEHGPDITPPVLSSPTAASTGTTSADIGVTTETPEGVLYYVLTTSATPPSKAQVKAGQNNAGAAAAWSGSQAISSIGAKTAGATGLSSGTTYYAYFMHEDATGNQSNVAAAASFATSAASPAAAAVTDAKAATAGYLGSGVYYDFTDVAIGTAADDRVVYAFVLVGESDTVAGVKFNGVAGTKVDQILTNNMVVYKGLVASGTTATISVAAAVNTNSIWLCVATATGLSTEASVAKLAYGFNVSPHQVTVNTPSGGRSIIFGVAEVPTANPGTWSNATLGANVYFGSITFEGAVKSAAGSATVGVTGWGNKNSALICLDLGV